MPVSSAVSARSRGLYRQLMRAVQKTPPNLQPYYRNAVVGGYTAHRDVSVHEGGVRVCPCHVPTNRRSVHVQP